MAQPVLICGLFVLFVATTCNIRKNEGINTTGVTLANRTWASMDKYPLPRASCRLHWRILFRVSHRVLVKVSIHCPVQQAAQLYSLAIYFPETFSVSQATHFFPTGLHSKINCLCTYAAYSLFRDNPSCTGLFLACLVDGLSISSPNRINRIHLSIDLL